MVAQTIQKYTLRHAHVTALQIAFQLALRNSLFAPSTRTPSFYHPRPLLNAMSTTNAPHPPTYTLAVLDLHSPPTPPSTGTGIDTNPVVVVTKTHKNANTILLDYPPGAYTAMRTFSRLGIMDFSGHVARLTNSLSQIHFPESDRITAGEDVDVESEELVVKKGLAPFRDTGRLKVVMADVVTKVLRAYCTRNEAGEGDSEVKVTVLCTWNVKVRLDVFMDVHSRWYRMQDEFF